jgi:hypothetical protein
MDELIFVNNQITFLESIKPILVSKFEMINSREVTYYLGIQIKRNKG